MKMTLQPLPQGETRSVHANTISLCHTHTEAPLEHPCAHWYHKPTSHIANKSISTYCMQTLPQTHLIWGAPQPSLPVFSLLWSPPGPPPMTPAPQNWPSTASFRPSCPPSRRAWGPTSYPASVCFCTPPLTPQASIASSQALRAPLWQRKPWVLRPACSRASCSLTHSPSTQTSALFPENTSYPQPHRHLSPARYTLTFYLTCPAHLLYTPRHSPQPSCLQRDLYHFSSLPYAMCIPLLFTFLHKTPTPRSTFP